ncbi:hypothetical protein [Nostoc sp. LPT]|uniref:hypothetical protein n=1 Tax=Nostoc sp. LPT TaxID=2815387 RepID=UPI001D431089|nr:hypothetical protein [Nostoc sp. LPT]MBN4003570.1 hypothetical protein [Nostoc sp. LPT]
MYFKDLSDPEKHSNKFGMIQLDFSRKVDFLISILAKSGIRFSPFDYHTPQVTGYLITLDEWRSWLSQTLVKNDPRWLWRVDDIELKADSRIQMHQNFLHQLGIQESNLNWANIRAYFIKEITWLDEQYRQVVQEYSTPEIEEEWMQDKRISQDWEVYLRTNHSNPNIEELLTAIKHPEGGINSVHKAYFVNYPIFVKCSIGLNTIIGVPKEPDFNIQSVIDEIERLVRE